MDCQNRGSDGQEAIRVPRIGPVSYVPRIGPATPRPGACGLPVMSVNGQLPDRTGCVTLGFYEKPAGGIPASDLASGVTGLLNGALQMTPEALYALLAGKSDKSDTYTAAQADAAIAAAIAAVVNAAPAAFDTLKKISDWIGDGTSGAQAVINQVANKVDKVAGKGLSTNDYTSADKEKLSGVEAGAKDNVVEAASASAFPQTGATGKIYVAKDENKTYRWNGSQYVQIGGGGGSSVTVDPTLSVEGAAADAKATGDALAGKRDKDDLALYRKVGVGETWTLVGNGGTSTTATGTFDSGTETWTFTRNGYTIGQSSSGKTADAFETEWSGDPEFGYSGTATRPFAYQPVTGDALAKTSQLPNVALTPVYSQTPSGGEWTILRDDVDVTSRVSQPAFVAVLGEWSVNESVLSGEITTDSPIQGASDLTSLTWHSDPQDASSGISGATYTATRTVIGYTLGSQTTKPLQPQGNYAPATNIAKTALASGVQTSLGKADTAVQPAALRYDLVQTITLGQLQDRAVQKVVLNAATTTLVLPALTDLSGKVSDFGIDVINAYAPEVDGTPTPTAASFQLAGTLGTDYNLIVPKGETWSDMTALAAGEMAVYYFTRSAFQIGDVPTWEVVKKVVELVPVPTAP